MPGPARRPTLADVAAAASVSVTTTSDALNGTGRVDERTRQLVRETARSLGYRMNLRARSLGDSDSKLIVTLVQDMPSGEAIRSPKAHWERLSYAFSQALAEAEIANAVVPVGALEFVDRLAIDAIILVDPVGDAERIPQLMPFGVPVLVVNPPPGSNGFTAAIRTGYDGVLADSLVHLLEAGAVRPALIITPKPMTPLPLVISSYTQWCEAHGVPVSYRQTLDVPAAAAELLAEGADAFLIHGDDTLNDVESLLAALASAGKRVPDDVLVLSLSEGLREPQMNPPVTTMSSLGAQAGRRAAEMIIGGFRTGHFEDLLVSHQLTIRESTARTEMPNRSGAQIV